MYRIRVILLDKGKVFCSPFYLSFEILHKGSFTTYVKISLNFLLEEEQQIKRYFVRCFFFFSGSFQSSVGIAKFLISKNKYTMLELLIKKNDAFIIVVAKSLNKSLNNFIIKILAMYCYYIIIHMEKIDSTISTNFAFEH